jgi:hypothetical protein
METIDATSRHPVAVLVPVFLWSQTEQDKLDVLIKDGTVYDGDPIRADIGIKGDRVVVRVAMDRTLTLQRDLP